MDNESLLKLKKRLAALPILQDSLQRLHARIHEAKADVASLLQKYKKESLDVERIEKESLSATLLKLFGRYEGRVDKEIREMIHAKTQYDAAKVRLRELECEAVNLKSRIDELNRDGHAYQDELERREALLRTSISNEASKAFRKLELEGESLARQLIETEEALRAANRAYDTACRALEYLDDAEGWASYDVWFSKGLFSHMAKYEKLDKAQEAFDRMNSQILDLQAELHDIHLDMNFQPIAIDSATRFFDIWLDNIITDLKVRDQIRDFQDYTRELCCKIQRIINKLEDTVRELNEAIRETEIKQEEIILRFEAES